MCFQTVKDKVEYVAREVYDHAAVAVSGKERPSPKGRVKNLKRYKASDGLWYIRFGGWADKPRVTGVANSNSMEPTIDEPFTHVFIKADPDDLAVGDIATYRNWQGGETVHAIVQILFDPKRWFRLKGYNNKGADQQKVRDEIINDVMVAIIFTEEEVSLP